MSTSKHRRKIARPAPTRAEILGYLAARGRPVSERSLLRNFALGKSGARDELAARLERMRRDGQILLDRRGRYALPDRMDMLRGRIIGHRDGYGFLQPEAGGEDLFLSAREMRKVLHGDRVIGRVARVDRRGRKEGTVVEVLERGNATVVGRYVSEQGIGYVAPEDARISQDIFVPAQGRGGAQPGQIVVAVIEQQPSVRTQPTGRIVEVLGEHMAPGMEIEIAIRKHGIPFQWPPGLEKELERLDQGNVDAAAAHRLDLRKLPLVTIDGEDARDFDDAVYCERRGRGWRLVVAIADVSHYVRPDSGLDQEAAARGNSVYFPQQVIPMLPELLSNDLCSLKPGVDRLCFACDMELDSHGEVMEYRFAEAVMQSRARLTYTEVAAALVEGDGEARARLDHLLGQLQDLHALSQVLRRLRERAGTVDFDLPETRIVFDAERKIEKIEPTQRNDAHRLIEECMLVANRCAALQMLEHKGPGVYRVHEPPELGKVEDLRRFIGQFGLSLGGGDEPAPRHYADVVKAVAERPIANMVQTALLRSLKQAVYSIHNDGHFALNFDEYTHFTSPIRRYPDLLVHRLIKQQLRGRMAARDAAGGMHLDHWAEHCSMTERRADEATRDVIQWLKAEYMMDRVGEEFWGVISNVTDFGVFVGLETLYVEGLVHVTALGNDYFHFDPLGRRLSGERTGTRFQIGDRIKVKVVNVNLDEAKIDFEPAAAPRRKHKRRRRA